MRVVALSSKLLESLWKFVYTVFTGYFVPLQCLWHFVSPLSILPQLSERLYLFMLDVLIVRKLMIYYV
jgi:hypothetical protein